MKKIYLDWNILMFIEELKKKISHWLRRIAFKQVETFNVPHVTFQNCFQSLRSYLNIRSVKSDCISEKIYLNENLFLPGFN